MELIDNTLRLSSLLDIYSVHPESEKGVIREPTRCAHDHLPLFSLHIYCCSAGGTVLATSFKLPLSAEA